MTFLNNFCIMLVLRFKHLQTKHLQTLCDKTLGELTPQKQTYTTATRSGGFKYRIYVTVYYLGELRRPGQIQKGTSNKGIPLVYCLGNPTCV